MTEQVFTVIVADDEEELREAVCNLIDWESIGYRLVARAGNGLDALQLVEQYQPDLLLTDIRMPFISGTELARQVKEVQPLIQVAFLSGYDDFEYARSAIDNQVISYMLKPITIQELTESLQDIHRRMEDRFRVNVSEKDTASGPAQTVTALLLDDFGDQPAEASLRSRLSACGLPVEEGDVFLVTVVTAEGTDETMRHIAAVSDNVLQKSFRCCSIVSGNRVISLVMNAGGFDQADVILDELYYMIKRVAGDCTIGISAPFREIAGCHQACREAVDAARLAGETGIHRTSRAQAAAERVMDDEKRSASIFDRLIFSGGKNALETYLDSVLTNEDGELAAMQILVASQGIFRSVLGEEAARGLQKRFGLLDPLTAGTSADVFRRSVRQFCLAGSEEIASHKKDGMRLLVEETLRIIDQEYMDESLTLNSVSERLHVSPNYLSANVKKYADDTFIKLLIKRRMETAASLIRAGNLRIAEVAWRCGYSDQHYFSYCFKKYFGMSPAKMRQGEEKK